MHISESLGDDGIASEFVAGDDHILLIKPLETVEQMTKILDFLIGDEIWQNIYEYK